MKKLLFILMLIPTLMLAQTPSLTELYKKYLPYIVEVKQEVDYKAKVEYYSGQLSRVTVKRAISSYSLDIPELNFVYSSPPLDGVVFTDSIVYFGSKVGLRNVKEFQLLRETWYDENKNIIKDIVHAEENEVDLKDEIFVQTISGYILDEMKKYQTN